MFNYFYNSSIRKYILLMGALFNNIKVAREVDGKVLHNKVPITYASKERFISKMNNVTSNTYDGDIAKVETILPRMYLNMIDLVYTQQFKTNVTNRRIKSSIDDKKVKSTAQFNPVPYKFMFELGIFTRHEDDMFQIVEQILPYFQPHFNTTIKEMYGKSVVIDRDVPITLQSVIMDEDTEGDGFSRRRIEWTLVFEVDAWLYPPQDDIGGEIRTIYLDFYANAKDLNSESSTFESVDNEVDPRDIDKDKWDGKVKQTYSENKPIPKPPEPPGPRILNDKMD